MGRDRPVLVALGGGTIFHALSHAGTALAAGLLARALVGGPGAAVWTPIQLAYVGLGAVVVKAIASVFLGFGESRVAGQVGARLRRKLARRALDNGLCDSAPRVLAIIAVRVHELEAATRAGALGSVRAVAQLVPLALALIFVSPRLALGGLLLLLPFGLGLSAVRRRWRRASDDAQRRVEALHTGLDELLTHLDLWRSYGAGARIGRALDAAGEQVVDAGARVSATRAALSSSNEVLAALALLGAIVLADRFGLPLGDGSLVVFAAVFFMAYRPLRDLGDARAHLATGVVAYDAVRELLVDDDGREDRLDDAAEAAEAREHTAAVGGSSGFGPPATSPGDSVDRRPEWLELVDVEVPGRCPATSLAVAPGEIVCVTGPTGSGKTTLLRALLGLERARGHVTFGRAVLDDAPVGPRDRPFAWVPQDAPLVTDTIAENVALFGGDVAAGQRALELIGAHRLAERADEVVGPGGNALSGGERRQVSIARALVSGLPVLLLDEPTEGLDPEGADAVMTAIDRVRGSRSVLLVTHRPEVRRTATRSVSIGSAASERSARRPAAAE